MVVSGAGAAAIACCEFFVRLGMRREHIVLVDTRASSTAAAPKG